MIFPSIVASAPRQNFCSGSVRAVDGSMRAVGRRWTLLAKSLDMCGIPMRVVDKVVRFTLASAPRQSGNVRAADRRRTLLAKTLDKRRIPVRVTA